MSILLPMIPIADVSADLPVNQRVCFTMDGRHACCPDNFGGDHFDWVLQVDTQKRISFTKLNGDPMSLSTSFYRNYIPRVLWNATNQQFISLFGGADQQFWDIRDNGQFMRISPLTDILFHSERIQKTINISGIFFGFMDQSGIIPTANVIWNEADPTADQIAPITVYGNGTALVFGSTDYNNSVYMMIQGINTAVPTIYVYKNFASGSVTQIEQGIFFSFQDPLFPLENGLPTPDGQPINDTGAFTNYNFQRYKNKMVISSVGNNGSNTPISHVFGTTDYTGMSTTPPFDLMIGRNFYSPAVPLQFRLTSNGKTYALGNTNGLLRGMTVIGDTAYAVVQYNLTNGIAAPAHILLAVGIAQLFHLQQDTLNWKRSLRYGQKG